MKLETTLNPYFRDYFPWLLNEYYDQELWVWLALPLAFLAAYLVSSIVIRLTTASLHLVIARHHECFYQRYIVPMQAPVELWIGVVVFAAAIALLPLSEETEAAIGSFTMFAATFAVVWAIFRLISGVGEALHERLAEKGKPGAAAVVPLLQKVAKVLVAVLALLFLLQNWGFDVAALLAGLGIGGVAIALAGQKTIENLFGGVSVTLDQPVRVGDFIKFDGMVGHVEDIGLRSTQIRTLNRTLVSIPNAQFSEMQLENFAVRDKMLLKTTIGVRYETTTDQMRYIIMEITKLFIRHEMVENDGRARFVGFGNSSLDIELFAYTRTDDWGTFLAIREDIFLRIMEIVQEAGSDFAFPSTTVYFERGGGVSPEKREEIYRKVEAMREHKSLAYPSVPDTEREQIVDSIPYPPPGSADQPSAQPPKKGRASSRARKKG